MFAKRIIFAFIAFSFIFVAEAFARKGSRQRDDIEKTKISRKLTSDKKRGEQKKRALKVQQRKNLQLMKRRQAQLKKEQQKQNRELRRKQQAQLKEAQKRKKQAQPKKAQASKGKPAPRVFKEPTPYYVKVRDLPKDQQKQAAKHMGFRNLDKEGMIKFAHSDLDPQKTPTFKEFLDIKEQNRKAKKKTSSGFEVFEYKDKNNLTYAAPREYSNKRSGKKESNWSWPWNNN